MSTRTGFHLRMAAGLLIVLAGSFPGAILAGEGAEPPPLPRTRPLAYYQSLVSTMLPSYGMSMISVPDGVDWMAGKSVHSVAQAVGDSDPGTIVSHGSILMGYDPPNGPRYIKLDFAEGYIRYTNRNRSFHSGSPCTAVSTSEAESALMATAGSMGIPTTEWDTRTVNTVMEGTVAGEGQDPPTEASCQVERIVTMDRKSSNGYPVFESKVRESVSNLHERARLLIDWPQFKLATGLIMRTRTDVVTDLAQQLWDAENNASGLGADVNLEIAIGYLNTGSGTVPVARAAFIDTYDRDAGQVLYVLLAKDPASEVGGDVALTSVQFRVRPDGGNGSALMEFYLPRSMNVRLTVMDVSGRELVRLAEADYRDGWHQVEWNLRDRDGRRVANGVYFARLDAGGAAPTRKILVVR
jgi:hypothetical protein